LVSWLAEEDLMYALGNRRIFVGDVRQYSLVVNCILTHNGRIFVCGYLGLAATAEGKGTVGALLVVLGLREGLVGVVEFG
jgi:hypothetical protein